MIRVARSEKQLLGLSSSLFLSIKNLDEYDTVGQRNFIKLSSCAIIKDQLIHNSTCANF